MQNEMVKPLVSIVIASYNMAHTLAETIRSIEAQTYKNIEIIIYDDCSTDRTRLMFAWKHHMCKTDIKYYRGETNVGVGNAFNQAIEKATGEYVMLFCADDLFTDNNVIADMLTLFNNGVGYVTRYYYQFIDGDKNRKPVRAWRENSPFILANNPSGLMFRQEALIGKKCTNKMFLETAQLVYEVLKAGWGHAILPYDAIAVRVHASTSTQGGYWLKRRVSSPVLDWYSIGGTEILKDYCSLIQIKCNYKLSAVLEEIWNFVKLRPKNLLNPLFYAYATLAVMMPRFILRKLPHLYRKYIGVNIVKEIKRNEICDFRG